MVVGFETKVVNAAHPAFLAETSARLSAGATLIQAARAGARAGDVSAWETLSPKNQASIREVNGAPLAEGLRISSAQGIEGGQLRLTPARYGDSTN